MTDGLHLHPGVVLDDVRQAGEGQLALLAQLGGEHGDGDQVPVPAADELQQVNREPLGVVQGEGGVGVVDAEVDRAHHQLLAVLAVAELGPEGGVALAPPHGAVPLLLQELGQLGPGAVVPHQVGVLAVRVQHLEHIVRLVVVQLPGQVGGQHGLQPRLHYRVVRGHAGLGQVAAQPGQGAHRELGEVVGDGLLVGAALALLHAALLQRVVVLEECEQEVPQHPGLEEVHLQDAVHRQARHALYGHTKEFRVNFL